jgi:hypothetical protein
LVLPEPVVFTVQTRKAYALSKFLIEYAVCPPLLRVGGGCGLCAGESEVLSGVRQVCRLRHPSGTARSTQCAGRLSRRPLRPHRVSFSRVLQTRRQAHRLPQSPRPRRPLVRCASLRMRPLSIQGRNGHQITELIWSSNYGGFQNDQTCFDETKGFYPC